LGPRLEPGDVVLDLACGDGGLAEFLPGLGYRGVDASAEMVAAAARRGRNVVQADLNEYEPDAPIHATTIFRAIYYARDRRALLERIASYTEKKLVFDLNPRQYRLADVRADLRAAGFDRLELKPFFVPQTVAPRAPVARLLRVAEQIGPVARLLLRARFTYMCSAFRSDAR
jgi:SAM-dependent methyltransferase